MKQISNHRKPAARTLTALATIALLMLAPTACVNSLPGEEDPGTGTNPEAMLDPATPVALTATLGTYGTASPTRAAASPTRAASTDLALIPAEGEITASTAMGTAAGTASANFALYGASGNSNYSTTQDGTVGNFTIADGSGNAIEGGLLMKDFNTSGTAPDGTQQRHSRLGQATFSNSNDALIGFADRTLTTDRKSAAYTFALRHVTAKVSVLVVDGAGVAIDLDAALDTDPTKAPWLTAYQSNPYYYETENTTAPAETQRRALNEYMFIKKADGSYPGTTTANAAFACTPTAVLQAFYLKQPTVGTDLPTNLMNVIVQTNPTVKVNGSYPATYYPAITPGEAVTVGGSAITAIATGLSGVNDPVGVLPFDATAGKTNPHRITLSLKADTESATPAGTYSINLNDIVLTGLPAGDGRTTAPSAAEPTRAASTTGTLRYLLPGEHVVVTLKIDRNKILSATAILAPWTEATADGGNLGDADMPGGDSEMAILFADKNFSAALAAMKFDADGDVSTTGTGTQKLTLNDKGCIDITSAANLTLISKIKTISSLSYKDITSLAGIELFTVLTELNCSDNNLTTLDVSQNTVLTKLSCSYNNLTTLDVSQNTDLAYLSCSGNRLTALDVSKNTALAHLSCNNNELTTLDVSKNTALTSLLDCSGNQLTTLDVSQNTDLANLNCSNNRLTVLDISSNTTLSNLYCYGNRLATLDASKMTSPTGYNLQCGKQTTDGITAQTLALTLCQKQATRWNYSEQTKANNLDTVNVTYND